jgi:prophage regulatory protein
MVSNYKHINLQETGFLRLPQVLQIVPVGKSTWWAGVKSGRYPKGQKLSPRTTAWKVEDIRALVAELSNEGGNA